jgi:hypothetical protein
MEVVNQRKVEFPYNIDKAVQASSFMLELAGGQMEYIHLIKLLYLADRQALQEWSRSISTDKYVSMKDGIVLSRILDHIKRNDNEVWSSHIQKKGYLVSIKKPFEKYSKLSKADKEVMKQIYEQYKEMDSWSLIEEVIHKLPEWDSSVVENNTQKPISLLTVFSSLNFPEQEVREIIEDIKYLK